MKSKGYFGIIAIGVLCTMLGMQEIKLLDSIKIFAAESEEKTEEYFDVEEEDWFFHAVSEMTKKEVISGYPDETFRPNQKVSYGEFITLAIKTAALDESMASEEDWKEEAASHWAEGYYEKGLALACYSHYDIKRSFLNEGIPRAHAALILNNLCGNRRIEAGESTGGRFGDVASADLYGYEIEKACQSGLLSGYPDGNFRPGSTLTRAEAAAVIQRLYNVRYGGGERKGDVKQFAEGNDGMEEKKAVQYLDQVLSSLKFYKEKDRYFFTVTFPELPQGFRIKFGNNVTFQSEARRPGWGLTTEWTQNEEDRISGTGTIVRQIRGMENLSQLSCACAQFSVVDEQDQIYAGYFVQSTPDENSFIVVKKDGKQIKQSCEFSQIFVWD